MTDLTVLRGAIVFALLTTLAACGDSTPAPSSTAATPNSTSVASTGTALVALSASTYSVPKSSATAVVTINRSGNPSGAASVAYTTVNGTATAGTDYSPTSGTVSWADGDASAKSVAVPVTTQAAGKTFSVALTAVSGDASFGSPTSATIAVAAAGASNLTPSASGTTIPSATQIVDSALNVWTVVSGVVYKNAAAAGVSANVTLLLYYSGAIYQENKSCLWWSWNGSAWVSASDPSPSTIPACSSAATSASVARRPIPRSPSQPAAAAAA